MSDHTSGWWRIGDEPGTVVSDKCDGIFRDEDCGRAEIHKKHYGDYCVAESIASCNAGLIAAAPELLEACRALAKCEQQRQKRPGGNMAPPRDEYTKAIEKAQWALDKLEGEEQKTNEWS